MSIQLDRWSGDFGRAYTDRNRVDPLTRVATLDRIIPRDVNDVLEVGCNRGHNLVAIKHARPNVYTIGVEPSLYAREQAGAAGVPTVAGDIYAIPYETDGFDVVFTCGVLEHVPPDRLDDALAELHRVSARYLLAIEYHADQDESVEYRGHDDMLWKRDYGAHWARLFPELELLSSGDLGEEFDRARYWLLEKPR